VDLNADFGTSRKKYQVRGLVEIFKSYKFTIAENTPFEEDVALDPELLGQVFENLLAAYNPETQTTARKQTGSFYTPREIVNYMVDESLIAYLKSQLLKENVAFLEVGKKQIDFFGNEYKAGQLTIQEQLNLNPFKGKEAELEQNLRQLLSYTDELHKFTDAEVERLIQALDNCKILDPACGSGAFPMGVLQKMVHILAKLDPHNERWKNQQKEREILPLLEDLQQAQRISYEQAREAAVSQLQERLAQIEVDFDNNEKDYPRKLFLIENCIYGVDIQPIALQIAKLRCFISLIVEQKVDNSQPNRGILPLPNLETKFVAANSLISLPIQMSLRSPAVQEREKELKEVRQKHFMARSKATKDKYRNRDQELRNEIGDLLKGTGLEMALADSLVRWNPYNQNTSADFFDPEWMFGIADGFDIVIGNPPYIGQKGNNEIFAPVKSSPLGIFHQRRMDYFYFFFHQAINLARTNGIISFITTNYFITADSADKLRKDIKDRTSIKELINFNELKVFGSAMGQHSLITILCKNKNNDSVKISNVKNKGLAGVDVLQKILNKSDKDTSYFLIPNQSVYDGILNYIRLPSSIGTISENDRILESIKNAGKTVSGICHITQGIVTGADKLSYSHIKKYNIEGNIGDGIFVLTDEEIERLELDKLDYKHLKPWFKNSDISKWITNESSNESLIYFTSKTEEEISKKLLSHFEKYKFILINRNTRSGTHLITPRIYDEYVKGEYNISYVMIASAFKKGKYYCISYARDDEYFTSPKIVSPQRSYTNQFAYTEKPWYASADVYFISQKDHSVSLKFILGVLNSKVIYFWLYNRGKRKGEMLELYLTPLSEIPIPTATEAEQKAIEILVKKCLDAKGQNVGQWEQEIDEIVARLYGLSDEEMGIIRGNTD
jgi:hypothetical protein